MMTSMDESMLPVTRKMANPCPDAVSRPFGPARRGTPVCCILGASFGTRNLGVSALASSTVASILSSFPNARVFFLDYGKLPATCQIKHAAGVAAVKLVNLRFSWKLHLRNNIARLLATALVLKLVPSKNLRERLVRRNPYLKQIAEADIIGSLAGGDSFSDIYGLRRFFYVALPQFLVLFLDKPLTLLPQTFGPFNGLVTRKVAGFILRKAEQAYARDRESLDEIRPLMGRSRAQPAFSPDMAFLLEPIMPIKQPSWLKNNGQSAPLVGFNVSGLLYSGGYTRNNMFGLRSDYKGLVQQIIDHFIVQLGARVVLVPHVFGDAGDLESDTSAGVAICRELGDQYRGRLQMISEEYDQHEMKYLIGQCDFFIGSRMHACIAALSQGVPAVGLAYSNKFLGVLRTVGAEGLVADLRERDTMEVMALVENAYLLRQKTRSDLAGRMPLVRQTVANLFARAVSERKGLLRLDKKTAPVPV
ncbi:MAG: polysaccharide pyruvyl transferase family protein [Verrucomicrobiia bacterium]